MIRAVVFDFDGVVLESANVKTEAFVELYADHGPEVVAKVRVHHLANLGISRFKKFEWIARNVFGEELSQAASEALGTRFSDLALAKVLTAPFVEGAEQALAELCERHPLFVASGTPQAELTMIVDKRGIASRFREVHGTPAEKPAIIDGLRHRYELARNEVLFVGDGMTDYEAARASGVEFLARDTPALHDEWLRLGVRRVPDLTRLVEVVASW